MYKTSFPLKGYKPLITRPQAQKPLNDLAKLIDQVSEGTCIYIDFKGVDGCDYSFNNEFFGKTLLALKHSGWKKFLTVVNLTDDVRDDLKQALEAIDQVITESIGSRSTLLGKVNLIDSGTHEAIASYNKEVSSKELSDELKISPNTMNERLSKLVDMGVVKKSASVSSAGREQYVYSVPR